MEKYTFQAVVQLTLGYNDNKSSKLVNCKLGFEGSDNLRIEEYISDEGKMTEIGGEAMTNTLVQGLSAHIHQLHKTGVRNDAEHLRYVIKELEEGFMRHVDVSTDDTLDDLNGS